MLSQIAERIKSAFWWDWQFAFPHLWGRGANSRRRGRNIATQHPCELAIRDSEFLIPSRPDITEALSKGQGGFNFGPTCAEDGRFYNSAFGLFSHIVAPSITQILFRRYHEFYALARGKDVYGRPRLNERSDSGSEDVHGRLR